jgi:hypothetical protein
LGRRRFDGIIATAGLLQGCAGAGADNLLYSICS